MNIAKTRRPTRAIGLVISVAAATFSLTLLAQVSSLRPGEYEAVSDVSLQGRSMNMPTRKDVVCLTAEDLKNLPEKLMKTAQGCKPTESTVTATGLKFTRECTSPDGAHVTYAGDVTFTSSESYHEVVNIHDSSGRSTNPLLRGSTMTITAKRTGECTK